MSVVIKPFKLLVRLILTTCHTQVVHRHTSHVITTVPSRASSDSLHLWHGLVSKSDNLLMNNGELTGEQRCVTSATCIRRNEKQLATWLTTSLSPPETILSPYHDTCLSDTTFNLLQHPDAGLSLSAFRRVCNVQCI